MVASSAILLFALSSSLRRRTGYAQQVSGGYRKSTAMSYACFKCRRSFNAERSFIQHLNDTPQHGWELENEELSDNFQGISCYMECPYCSRSFDYFDAYLCHVLSSCPTTTKKYLYWNRHDEVLSVFLEAVAGSYSERDWKTLSVLENTYYCLPLGIRNAPGGRSPDILVYSKMRQTAVIIELSVPWETNIPRARLEAHARMQVWYEQFEERGYDCYCYNVEVGARGMLTNSFYDCLESLELDDEEISQYAQRCADMAIICSQDILRGKPWGSEY